jgi:hypothetical protein
MSTLGVDYVSSGLGVTKAALKTNRSEAKQFLMAMIDGAKILKTDEEFSLRVLAKHTRISDREVLKQSYSYLRPYFLKLPYPSTRAIKDTLDALAKDLPKAKDADPKDFIDNSILKEIESRGLYRICVCQMNRTTSSRPTIISICVGCPGIYGPSVCPFDFASAVRA